MRNPAQGNESVRLTRPDFTASFTRGIAHFNALEFWEAHEAWEEIWLAAQSEVEQFLQGLIQLAAAYHHLQRGTFPGGVRLFDAALKRLGAFPRPYCGLDLTEVETIAREHRQWMAAQLAAGRREEKLDPTAYPKLFLRESESCPVPPREDW